MKKHIVLSVNDNPTYLFHVPLTVWAWRKIGWEPIIFFHWPINTDTQLQIEKLILEASNADKNFFIVKSIDRYLSETLTQVSRLYAACFNDNYLMTGDVDMVPLSNYWHPNFDKLTVWGRDLTDYHYPICYIGAPAEIWKSIMSLNSRDYNTLIKRDLDNMPNAKGSDKIKRWVVDQDLITERINESCYVPEMIGRGTYLNGYPVGRVDRSVWNLNHNPFIDAHLFHDAHVNYKSFNLILGMLKTVWPQEDFSWWIEYRKQFNRLLK